MIKLFADITDGHPAIVLDSCCTCGCLLPICLGNQQDNFCLAQNSLNIYFIYHKTNHFVREWIFHVAAVLECFTLPVQTENDRSIFVIFHWSEWVKDTFWIGQSLPISPLWFYSSLDIGKPKTGKGKTIPTFMQICLQANSTGTPIITTCLWIK